jgi:hypothetical protein
MFNAVTFAEQHVHAPAIDDVNNTQAWWQVPAVFAPKGLFTSPEWLFTSTESASRTGEIGARVFRWGRSLTALCCSVRVLLEAPRYFSATLQSIDPAFLQFGASC